MSAKKSIQSGYGLGESWGIIDRVGILPCYDTENMRQLDRRSALAQGLSEDELMIKAGEAAFRALSEKWPEAATLAVLCGRGNNGGDGWVVARLALEAGLACDVYVTGDPSDITGSAQCAHARWAAVSGTAPRPISVLFSNDVALDQYDLIVDALVGIGMTHRPRPEFEDWITALGGAQLPIMSLDIPSGLSADGGPSSGAAIRADLTMTFIAPKPVLLTGPRLDHVGDLIIDALDTPPSTYREITPVALALRNEHSGWLPARSRIAHKGSFGHVLVIGGDTGMGGAALLAAAGALRGGAGLVSLATRQCHVTAALSRYPEVMVRGIEDPSTLQNLLTGKDVIVIGPGLGQDVWGQTCLEIALKTSVPVVCDADAINLIASGVVSVSGAGPRVLTPHPGEAARLAGCTVTDIEADRLGWAKRLALQTQSTIALKGAGTVVAAPSPDALPIICCHGNPGMATGGMGDVLAGLIGALLAQRLEPIAATAIAVGAHAEAADMAWQEQGVGLTPSDVVERLGGVLTQV